MQRVFLALLTLLFVLTVPVASPLFAASDAELKKMGVFLSNFTELGLYDLDENDRYADELIYFGIWHNYVNNYQSRIRNCANCRWGNLKMDGRHAQESVKKYFGRTPKLASAEYGGQKFHYDGHDFHFEGADGEQHLYVRVQEATSDKGQVRMKGILYNSETGEETGGQCRALARPSVWQGKKTWTLISLHCERN